MIYLYLNKKQESKSLFFSKSIKINYFIHFTVKISYVHHFLHLIFLKPNHTDKKKRRTYEFSLYWRWRELKSTRTHLASEIRRGCCSSIQIFVWTCIDKQTEKIYKDFYPDTRFNMYKTDKCVGTFTNRKDIHVDFFFYFLNKVADCDQMLYLQKWSLNQRFSNC